MKDFEKYQKECVDAVYNVCAKLAEESEFGRAFTTAVGDLGDQIVVHFLEEDGSSLVMDAIQEFADLVHKATGRHYCMCNNSPTDGVVLVLSDPAMDEVFDKERHKKQFISSFDNWRVTKIPHIKPEMELVFQTLEEVIDRDSCGLEWQDELTYNIEFWYQVMYWHRNGFERSPK
jgi:hypothetical protein